MYSRESNYNLEHFVIPDIAIIQWLNEAQSLRIPIDRGLVVGNKRKTCNLLVMDHDLNESLSNYDIVTKIVKIREWYRNRSIPKHMEVFISLIEEMPEYQKLKSHKTDGASDDEITTDYQEFLKAYFAEDVEDELLAHLKEQFRRAFQN